MLAEEAKDPVAFEQRAEDKQKNAEFAQGDTEFVMLISGFDPLYRFPIDLLKNTILRWDLSVFYKYIFNGELI